MGEIILGILAVITGAIFALQGGNFMRIAFPIFGFVAGFSAGAGLASGVTGDGFLSTLFSWVVGLCVALLFAALAYFFYAFAVVLAFAGLGFSMVAFVLTAFHMDWNWLVVLLGTAAGVLFGIFAVVSSLPMIMLVVATSFFGVSMIIYGLLLILNIANFGDFANGNVYRGIRSHTGVYILWLTLGITAAMTQLRILGEQSKMAEQYWNGSKTFDDLLVEMNGPAKKSKK